MSTISEQVKKLKDSAYVYRTGGFPEASKLFLEAADIIEALSAKLQAANMECSAADCDEELNKAKETIRKLLCSEYGSSCQFCIQNNNENAMCRKVGGFGSWCCENAAWNGKSE